MREVGLFRLLRLMRMYSDARINVFILCGEFDRAIERSRAISSPNGKHVRDSAFMRPGDHLFAISIEAGTVKMAVGIDEHGIMF
jgi:hypothetical protein